MAVLAAASCRTTPANLRVDPSLRMLVPADTVLLAGLKLDSVRSTPVYQKHFAGRNFPQVEQFQRVTGIDPNKDLWELLLCSNGTDSLVLARGKFSPGDLEPKFEKEGVKRMVYNGSTMFGDETAAVMLMNSSTAVAGPTLALRKFADHKASKGSDLPAMLAPAVNAIPSTAQFWAAYAGAPAKIPVGANSNLENVNRLLSMVKKGTLSVDFRFGLDAQAIGYCDSTEDVQQIVTALRGLIGFARLSTRQDQADLLRLYDSIIVSPQGREAHLKVNVPAETVDKFVGAWLR